jgi:hypothetical protein
VTLTDSHIEAIKAAAASVEYGSVTIHMGSDKSLDITIQSRIRFPKEPEKPVHKPPLPAIARQRSN